MTLTYQFGQPPTRDRHPAPRATPPPYLTPYNLLQMQNICQAVAAAMQVPLSQLFLHRRGTAPVSRARQLAMAVARQTTGISLEGIGAYFRGRGHDTVIHACHTIRRRIKTDPALAATWHSLISSTAH